MGNSAATVENNMAITKKIKHQVTIWFSNSTTWYKPKRIESRDSNGHLRTTFIAVLFTIAKAENNPSAYQ